jgi:D-lactate dehydrogenase
MENLLDHTTLTGSTSREDERKMQPDLNLKIELSNLLSAERVLTRPLDRYAYANDASYFRLVPQAVVKPASINEICSLFQFSQQNHIPITFRAAGTSLSGQSVSNGILVALAHHWGNIQVEGGGARVRAQPGVVGADINNRLKPYGRRMGPDPASIDAAMLGGILANNSSGMCCGVAENAYHTIHSLTLVLPNGLVLDTAALDAAVRLQEGAPDIANGLLELRLRLLSDAALAERVRVRYQTKNTDGYSLNALLDFDNPIDILTHLMIGSEGTLGFIAEAVLNTLPNYTRKYTGQLYFRNIQDAARAIAPLRDSGARAAEIMERAALRSVENLAGAPAILRQLPDSAAAILVEYQGITAEDIASLRRISERTMKELRLLHDPEFTEDPAIQANLWKLRKGLFPTLGAMRPKGTSVMTEDVVFPIPRLAEAVTDLQSRFHTHGYEDAIIFGHAKDGNLHFNFSCLLNTPEEIQRLERFLDDVLIMVREKYDGALKGEHGTGRAVSPYLEAEWGPNGMSIMRDIKSLFDPSGMLNPDVIINPDPRAHVSNIKDMPTVEDEVDKCIECGFCEPRCPSRRLTLTPRQRIVIRREIARQRKSSADTPLLASLLEDFNYSGLETCAVDGLCASACPVNINTGDLTKHLRAGLVTPRGDKTAVWLSEHFMGVEKTLAFGIQLAHAAESVVGAKAIIGLTRFGEKLTGLTLPKWNTAVPHVPTRLPATRQAKADFIYFPSCISRRMGVPKPGMASLAETLVTVAKRAGVSLWIPQDVDGNCCGMPFGSKGYTAAYQATRQRTLERFWEWSEHGRLPIVIDTTSCTYTLRQYSGNLSGLTPEERPIFENLTLLDGLELMHDVLLPKLELHPVADAVVLHPNCSCRKLNLQDKMIAIASRCAKTATVPLNLDCCAFAGDRGLLFPELTASATSLESAEVNTRPYDGYYSSNITCEMGMTLATRHNYHSIVYLLEQASR